MATQVPYRYTLDEYLEKEEMLGYRSEFRDGTIYPVELATVTHALLEERIGMVLAKANPSCSIYGSSLNLYIESANKILRPDKTVICGKIEPPEAQLRSGPYLDCRGHITRDHRLRLS